MSKIKVGALDPSFSNFGMTKGIFDTDTGVLVLKDLRLVKTKPTKKYKRKNQDDLYRAKHLYDSMVEYLSKVDVVFVELPVGSQTARAMASYGACVGIVSALQKPIIVTDAKEGKLVLSGVPNATKKQMIAAAKDKYPDLNWLNTNDDEHLADAIAALLVGLKSHEFQFFNALKA